MAVVTGCSPSLEAIDLQVDHLMARETAAMGGDGVAPTTGQWSHVDVTWDEMLDNSPGTTNPAADELMFLPSPELDTEMIVSRLDANRVAQQHDEVTIGLQDVLAWATSHAREYQYAQEDYVLSCLSFLLENHLWGPQFNDTISATYDSKIDGGMRDTALNLVNEYSISQQLPNGGEVAVSALASLAHWVQDASGNADTQMLDLGLSAKIPLLRGSGSVARESLIQSMRNLIYAARTFERFRRSFLVDIAGSFLDLQVQRAALDNATFRIEQLELLSRTQQSLFAAGRIRYYAVADAENSALSAIASYNQSWESYRLSVDQFKVRIGYPLDQSTNVALQTLGLPVPEYSASGAIALAMNLRLDLQTRRNQLADTNRQLANANNALLPQLDFTATASIPSRSDTGSGGLDPDFDAIDWTAGVSLEIPLDQQTERIALRQAEIALHRAQREYRQFRDEIAVNVRSAVRTIDSNLFNLDLQRRNVEIAEMGLRSIEANPDATPVIDQLRAIDDLNAARDGEVAALRALELAILDLLLQTGQLRVDESGTIEPLENMDLP
jgi:hypothetical protein